MRYLVMGILVVLVAGCGGSSGDGVEEPMFDVSGIRHAEDADCALVSIPEDLTVTAFEGAVNAPAEIDCEYDAHKEEGA